MRATRIGGSRSSAFRVGTIQSVAMTANIIRCHHSFFIAFSFVFNGNPEPQQKVPRHLQAAIWHRVTVSSRAMKNRTYPEANLKVRDVRIRRVALCMPNGSNRRGILFMECRSGFLPMVRRFAIEHGPAPGRVAPSGQRNYLPQVSIVNVNGNRIFLFLSAFAAGVISGLRSMTALAVISWGARWGWLDLHRTPLEFLGATWFAYTITAFAAG